MLFEETAEMGDADLEFSSPLFEVDFAFGMVADFGGELIDDDLLPIGEFAEGSLFMEEQEEAFERPDGAVVGSGAEEFSDAEEVLAELLDVDDAYGFRIERKEASLGKDFGERAVKAESAVIVRGISGEFIFEAGTGVGDEDPGAFEFEHFSIADAQPEPAGTVELDSVIDRHMTAAVKIRHRRRQREEEVVVIIHSGIPFQQKQASVLLIL